MTMNTLNKRILCLALVALSQFAHAEDCEMWFAKAKIDKASSSCEIDCAIAPIGMGSFSCRNECGRMCEASATYYMLKKYGLTDAEISICEKRPILCAVGYWESMDADRLCLKIYPRSATNDESDACRHFTWAVLMADQMGVENAEKILEAHENNPQEPEEEKAMDLANNRKGLLTFNSLKKNKKISTDDVLSAFKNQLRNGQLIILKKKYQETGGLP